MDGMSLTLMDMSIINWPLLAVVAVAGAVIFGAAWLRQRLRPPLKTPPR